MERVLTDSEKDLLRGPIGDVSMERTVRAGRLLSEIATTLVAESESHSLADREAVAERVSAETSVAPADAQYGVYFALELGTLHEGEDGTVSTPAQQ